MFFWLVARVLLWDQMLFWSLDIACVYPPASPLYSNRRESTVCDLNRCSCVSGVEYQEVEVHLLREKTGFGFRILGGDEAVQAVSPEARDKARMGQDKQILVMDLLVHICTAPRAVNGNRQLNISVSCFSYCTLQKTYILDMYYGNTMFVWTSAMVNTVFWNVA